MVSKYALKSDLYIYTKGRVSNYKSLKKTKMKHEGEKSHFK